MKINDYLDKHISGPEYDTTANTQGTTVSKDSAKMYPIAKQLEKTKSAVSRSSDLKKVPPPSDHIIDEDKMRMIMKENFFKI